MDDPHDLHRFVEAQSRLYRQVCAELAVGIKTGHWMWFVFPQLRGLGHSAMARRFAIASEEEARAYWQHPVLGPRLRECTELVLRTEGRTAHEIFGSPDDLKFHSSMSLFAHVVPEEAVFRQALGQYFQGRPDPRTMEVLATFQKS